MPVCGGFASLCSLFESLSGHLLSFCSRFASQVFNVSVVV